MCLIFVACAALMAWLHLAFALILTTLVAAPVAALWVPSGPAGRDRAALRALSLNVSFYSRNYDEVLTLIQEMSPDVIGLVEHALDRRTRTTR